MKAIDTLLTTEGGIPKPIDARTHGIIDYCHAAFFLSLGLVCSRKNPKAAAAAIGTGAFVLVQSLLTDYPLGKKRWIPFSVHGLMDGGFAACSPFLPRLLGFSGTKAAVVFQLNGLIEGTAVALTDFDSQHARAAEHH